jgi:DNA mismatch repair ATPase MutS
VDSASTFIARNSYMPLIPANKTVPSNWRITGSTKKDRTIVITGDNGSGKSICLQMIGQQFVMLHAYAVGFSSEEVAFSLLDRIYMVSHTKDDVNENRSLFMQEIAAINSILQDVSLNRQKRILVLFDEPAKGTDAKEASAILLAILEMLQEHPAVLSVTVSHLDLWELNESVQTTITPYTMGFDLLIGYTRAVLPGRSKQPASLYTLRSMHFEPSVIARAVKILKKHRSYSKKANLPKK